MKKIKTNGGSLGDLGLVILAIIALFFLWYFVGGGQVHNQTPFMQAQDDQTVPAEVTN